MKMKKRYLVLLLACLALITIVVTVGIILANGEKGTENDVFVEPEKEVFVSDDSVGIETEANGMTISEYILHCGYTVPPEGHECVRHGETYSYSGWYDSSKEYDLELFTFHEWWVRIRINVSDTMEDVILAEKFGPEFGVCLVNWNGSREDPQLYTTEDSEQVLTWNVGDIQAGGQATVWVHVWTNQSSSEQEFTSYGTYYLNPEAIVKWKVDGTEYGVETGKLTVSTVSPP
jgi:hypothetical protein